ncbi:MAG: hypothetical protein AAF552_07085 [Pseudomonadota bacterium]
MTSQNTPIAADRRFSVPSTHLLMLVLGLLLLPLAEARPPIFATPDQADLIRAARSLQDGFERDAMQKFKKAARYGNKQAQKNVALMYIKGLGVEQDWARAYAWLKLASTHGDGRIVSARDEVLGALREDEQALANSYYEELNEEFGDLQALERRELWVRRQKREVTGSRLGKVGALRVQVTDATGYNWELSGPEYFGVLEDYLVTFRQNMGEVELKDFKVLEEDVAADTN